MANKTFNARLKLKYDSWDNWIANDPVLLAGEAAVAVIPADKGQVQGEPAVVVKIGDGTKKFSELGFISGLAADVYGWAKAPTKPSYSATEIAGLNDYIAGEIQDTDTQYKLVQDSTNGRRFYLYAKDKGSDFGLDPVSTIEIPEKVYTLATGSANGTVAFNGEDVAVKGLQSAAYETIESINTKIEDGDRAVLGTQFDTAGSTTVYGALGKANHAFAEAEEANTGVRTLTNKIGDIAEDKTVAETIVEAKNAVQGNLDAEVERATAAEEKALEDAKKYADDEDKKIEDKIGDIPAGQTVAEAIAAAKTAATYDDAELRGRIETNEGNIATLNGSADTAGSVDYKIAQAVAAIMENPDETMNSIKELVDWTVDHAQDALELQNKVTQDGKDIDALEALVGTTKVETQIANAITAALKVEGADKYALAENLTAAIARIVALEGIDHDAYVAADTALENKLQAQINNKVEKDGDKVLSTNDYTTAEKNKLRDIAEGAQVNVIEVVKVNGQALTPDGDKAVNVTVPTGALAGKDKVAEADLTTELAKKINDKLDASAVTGDLLTHNASEFAVAGHNHDTVYSKLGHNHKIEELEQTEYVIFDCGTSSTVI